jgi:hypothetical protein
LEIFENLEKEASILTPFRKWELHELPTLRKSNKEVWAVKTSVNLERPRYVILGFQTNRKDNAKSTSAEFEHLNITDMKVFLNSDCFPYETMKLDWENDRYSELYQMYLNLQESFLGRQPEPLISYGNFKSLPLYAFDTSKHKNNEAVLSSTCDLRVEFQSVNQFPDNTKAYCLVIHDSIIEYTPLTSIVQQIT